MGSTGTPSPRAASMRRTIWKWRCGPTLPHTPHGQRHRGFHEWRSGKYHCPPIERFSKSAADNESVDARQHIRGRSEIEGSVFAAMAFGNPARIFIELALLRRLRRQQEWTASLFRTRQHGAAGVA